MNAEFDTHWRSRALGGDATAVSQLARFALAPLYRFCYYRLGKDQHLSEDVVQETLVRAIRELSSYDPARSDDHIFPWLTGLARNEIRRVLAHRPPASLEALWMRIDRDLLDIFSRIESSAFDEDLLRQEQTREMVNAAMSQLPPQYASALEAKYVSARSVRDMAAASQTTEKAVESLLSRARTAFKATFLALSKNMDEIDPKISVRVTP